MARKCLRCAAGIAHTFRHGITGYGYHRCRCAECSAASRAETCKWRRSNPQRHHDHARTAYERVRNNPELVRQAGDRVRKWESRNPESLVAIKSRTAEKRSRARVTRRGNWTSAEDSVVSRTDITLLEMAYMTGRSYNSIAIRRSRMRRLAA